MKSDYSDIQMMQAKVQSVDTVPIPHIPVKVYLDKYSCNSLIFSDVGTVIRDH